MAGQYPSRGYVADSQTVLLRKICDNTAQLVDGGGGGGGGVTSIIAGAGISVDQATGAVTVSATGGAPGAYAAFTNNSGNSMLTPTKPVQTYLGTVGGAARTSIFILDVAGRTAGDKIFLDLILPATPAIVLVVRNATSGGTLLLPAEVFPAQSFTTDGTILSWHLEFTYTGTAWIYDSSNIPS